MKKHQSFRLPSLGVLRVLPLLFVCSFAHATVIEFHADLSGPAESPVNASPGLGLATILFDDVAQTMEVNVTFWNLLGTTTASHIHATTAAPNAGTAGVATETPFFDSFPIGVSAGSYTHLFDLTDADSFNPNFVNNNGGTLAGASQALKNAMVSEKAYLNIHTNKFPGGEIRGFLHVPDTASTALTLALALGALMGFSRLQKLRAC
jgi:hypothetical protein